MPPADRPRPRVLSAHGRTSSTAAAPALAGSDGPAANRGESVSRAYEQLRQLIVTGRLAPGSRIVESEIASRLGLSRTPARSALHRLQQEGYISSGDGVKEQRLVVAPLTQDDASELFQIVGQLEGLAARFSAELADAPRRKLVRTLGEINTTLAAEAGAERPDPLRIFELDTDFHRAYVVAASGPRLLALHDAIKPQGERYFRLYINSLVDEITTSVDEHQVIIQRIADADARGAQEAVDTNWRNAANRLYTVIATLGERGSW